MQTVFILDRNLGLLKMKIEEAIRGELKKNRTAGFNSAVAVLKGLGIVEKKAIVKGISLGLRSSGETGLFIELDTPAQVVGNTIPE